MRILHVTDRLSERGGADTYLLALLDELGRRGQRLWLAFGRDDGSARAPCPGSRIEGLDARARERVAPALDALVRRFRPDRIHVHNVMNPDGLDWAARHGALMTVQDHRYFCPGRGKLTLDGRVCTVPLGIQTCAGCFEAADYFARILRLTRERLAAVRRMPQLTVLSSYMRRELVGAGVEANRIVVLPPFVHGLDWRDPPSGPPCVLFAGRLTRAKGVDDALAAWRLADLDLPLVFAGSGPERRRLEALGAQVLGWVPHARMAGVYRRARALLFPPRWQEPFGLAGLEASSGGVPVVAWDSGAVREWHCGEYLLPYGDVQGLAGALEQAVKSRAPRPSGFSLQAHLTGLLELYAERTC